MSFVQNYKMTPVFLALEALLTRYVNLHRSEKGTLPSVQFDKPWPSPCLVDNSGTDLIEKLDSKQAELWRPIERNADHIFENIEKALECPFHSDFKQFYGSFWSNGICVERDDINFSLIQIWNEEDQEQLKENLMGHAFAKIKGRLPMSLFIGCTFGEDIICIDNESGQIVLEKPGYKAHKILSPSLEAFLLSLQPTLDNYSP